MLNLLEENNLHGMLEDFYTEFRLKEDCNIWLSFTGKELKKMKLESYSVYRSVAKYIRKKKNRSGA